MTAVFNGLNEFLENQLKFKAKSINDLSRINTAKE